MPVIVNDFEVVAEPAAQPAQNLSTAREVAPQPAGAVELLLAEQHARKERVRAY